MLGEAGRGRREQRAGVLVLVELEHERRADHLALVVAGRPCPLHPAGASSRRSARGSARRSPPARLSSGSPHVRTTWWSRSSRNGRSSSHVAERDVRRQSHRRREVGELDVVARPPRPRLDAAVVVDGPAADADARLAVEPAQDANEHQRLEVAVVEREARCEVEQLEAPARPAERRLRRRSCSRGTPV